MVTKAYLAWLLKHAELLANTAKPEASEVRSLKLLGTMARFPAESGELRLAQDNETNDLRIAALELNSKKETPFDPHRLGAALLAFSPVLPHILESRNPTPYYSGNDMDRFMGLTKLLGVPLMDRTGTFSSGLRVKIMEPIPAFDPGFSLSVEEVICQRCKELLAAHERLHLLWSGGIDSTAVVVGFLKVASPEDWERRLSVHYCPRSIGERPSFYEKFIKSLPHHEVIPNHVRDFIDGNRVVVTGDPADMLFGTHFMRNAFAGRTVSAEVASWSRGRVLTERRELPNHMHYALDKPWREVVPKLLRSRGLLASGAAAARDWFRWMEPQVAKAPIPIRTLFDWLWWMVYSCKFQFDLTRLFYNRPEVTQQLVDSLVNFYLSPAWHQWSFHNHDRKMQDKMVWASYKQPLKEFIYKFDGDQESYAGKVKLQSAHTSWGYQLAIDDRYNIIHFGRLSVSRRRMQEKYGDSLKRFMERPELFRPAPLPKPAAEE